MRVVWWGLAALLLLGAVLIPVGDALAPSGTSSPEQDAGEPADSSEYLPDVQKAPRTLADPDIGELSGLAASRRFPGVLYGLNDSGGGPYIYAIGPTGETLATLTLRGVKPRDWEAIAPGWDPDGTPVLWIGDIGDNGAKHEEVYLFKIQEPEELADQDVEWRSYSIRYADGSHDAEALLITPGDGLIQIATKGKNGNPGGLYELTDHPSTGGINTMQRVRSVPTSITDGAWELSPTGEPRLVLIDYLRIHRLDGDSWVSALGPLQVQREALAWPWLPDGSSNDDVLLGSEGHSSKIVVARVP